MQKKRLRKMSDRRRAVVATRKAQVAELKGERFAEIARLVSGHLEPLIERLVAAQVAKAMADLAERQSGSAKSKLRYLAEVAAAEGDNPGSHPVEGDLGSVPL